MREDIPTGSGNGLALIASNWAPINRGKKVDVQNVH